MEWKIGEVKQINREWYQCVEANENDNCNSCDLQGLCIRMQGKQHVGNCTNWRTDNKRAIFKKLEKVGRPFERNGYMYQEYKAHTYPLLISESATIPTHNGFAVIIKQNKEDMEEKKLNLKPFDIQKAREGKPVCTRDGRKARIICFDKKCLDEQILIVLVDCGKEESIYFYTTDGKCIDDFSSFDLMMPLEKKEGWVNVYRDCDGVNITKDDNIYSSKDAAISSAQVIDRDNYVATTIIRWEE